MTPSDLPYLTIKHVEQDCCTMHYDPSPWVSERAIAGVYLADDRLIWGRFRNVNLTECSCSFCPDEAGELADLKPGKRYPFVDGYWGERAELVLKEAGAWQRKRFEPRDMILFPSEAGGSMGMPLTADSPSEGKLVPGGWDHEHCEICHKKIGCGGEAEGYFRPPSEWVCEKCFTMFVEPKSLAFINMQ